MLNSLNKVLSLFGLMPEGKLNLGVLLYILSVVKPDVGGPLQALLQAFGVSLTTIGVAHKVVKAQMGNDA